MSNTETKESNVSQLRGGERKAKKPTKKKLQDEYMQAIQGLQTQAQFTQNILQQLLQNGQRLDSDVGNAMNIINDLQYRTLAMLELSGVNKDDLNAKADELKLKDFVTASDKEDTEKGLINDDAGVVSNDSIVIVSSTTPDEEEDRGIFRYKFVMGQSGQPTLEASLFDMKVGSTVEADFAGIKHVVTVRGIRKAPVVVAGTSETETPVE